MKFHHLDILNINSLYDKQQIDFDEHLSQTPLFLIMGPTGSGKTTILDAICLVLFGETPRQEGLPGSTVAERVMSEDTGKAQVILTFSRLDAGDVRHTYQGEWYCQRAYEDPGGNMQDPRRKLRKWDPEAQDWDVIVNTHGVNAARDAFRDALTGMTMDDFLRSVLLAQGRFTAFLKAEAREKANILEQLTSTDQYMRIGGRAKERWRQAKAAVREIENKMEGTQPLEDGAYEELKEKRSGLTERVDKTREEVDEVETKHDWLVRLGEYRETIAEAEQAREDALKARQEREDDFERYERAKQVQRAAALLLERDRLDGELAKLRDQIAERGERKEELQPELDEAKERVSGAREAHAAAKKTKAGMREELDRAKELHVEVGSARELVKGRADDADALADKVDELETTLAEEREKLAEAEESVDAASEALEELADYEGIGEEYAGLEADLKGVVADAERVAEQQDRIEALRTERVEAEGELEDVDEQLEQYELEALEEEARKAREDLDELVGDDENLASRRQSLRERIDEARDTRSAYESVASMLDELEAELDANTERKETRDDLEGRIAKTKGRLETLGGELETAKEVLGERERTLDACEAAAQFAEAREALSDGEACPVCGSESHPWGGGAHPDEEVIAERNRALERVEKKRDEVGDLEEQHRGLRDEVTELKADKNALEEIIESSNERSQKIAEDIRATAGDDELEPVDELEQTREDVAGILADGGEVIEELERRREALDDAEAQFEEAKDALEAAQEEQSDALERKRELEQTIDGLGERLSEAKHELQTRLDAWRASLDALVERLSAVGIDVELPDVELEARAEIRGELNAALETADEKRKAREQAGERLEEAERERDALAREVEAIAETRLPERKTELEEANKKLETSRKKLAKLELQAEEVLDGRDPDEVEEELDAAIEEAESQVKEAETRRDEITDEVKKLDNEIEDRETRREALGQKRDDVDEELDAALEEVEVEDVDELREAMLEPADLDALDESLEPIRDRLKETKVTLKNAKQGLEQHREDRPEQLGEDADVDELGEELEELEEELAEQQRELGAVGQQLEDEKERRERYAELLEALEERNDELELWDRIQGLIGVNNGAKFKEFAQAMNLQLIVHHANEHLRQLHDRYRLAVEEEDGHPTLDFAVVDREMSNETRSITTLSGGETFLVSLALALALADFRRVSMPVETLLLDEGFGTLDQQSLDQAVSTLKTLHHRENRQVGVISHVERLQEEIQHRVSVEKLSGGRSKIEVETP